MKLSEIKKLTQTFAAISHGGDPKNAPEVLKTLGIEPGSLYQELEMDSRFVDTHRDITYSGANVNLHSHSFYELLLCHSCEGVEYLVGTDRYRLQPGDIILISPGISHCPLLPEDMQQPYVRDVVWISPDFMDRLIDMFPFMVRDTLPFAALLRTDPLRQDILGTLFRNGIQESERRASGWELAVLGNTVQLLAQLNRAFAEHSAAPLQAEKPELLNRVMAFVEANLEEKITLQDIAHRFFVSESTISHSFRQKMGISFYHFVTQRRLIAAKLLIAEGIALEIVAQQVGFSDYSSFYRAFRQEYGISPRNYRKLQTENEPAL